MTCKNCGYELKENNKFCPKCGTATEMRAEPSVQPAPSVQEVKPQVQNVQPQAQSVAAVPKKKKKSKAPVIIVSLLLVFLLLTGAAAAALYFTDPFDWFEKDVSAVKSEEEKEELTEDMLDGYWVMSVDYNDFFKELFKEEFSEDIDLTDEIGSLDDYLFFDGSKVSMCNIAQEELDITEKAFITVYKNMAASEEYQEETGLSQEELYESLVESIYTEEVFLSIMIDDMIMEGIFCIPEDDHELKYKIKENTVYISADSMELTLEYEEDKLIVKECETDEDDYPASFIDGFIGKEYVKVSEKELEELEEEYEEIDEDYIRGWLEERAPEKKAFSFGKINGQNYESDYLGIGCTLDESWKLYTEEEVMELNGADFSSIGEDINEYFKNGMVAFDMYAIHENMTDSVNVLIEPTDIDALGMTMDEYMDLSADKLFASEFAQILSNLTTEKGVVEIGGKEIPALLVEGSGNGLSVYETVALVKLDDCIVAITVATFNENSCEDVLSQFYFIE